MSDWFYPDSLEDSIAGAGLIVEEDHSDEEPFPWTINTRSDHGYWAEPYEEAPFTRDITEINLANITDGSTSTKMTCWSLLWVSWAGVDDYYWGYWLKIKTSTPRVCDSIKLLYGRQDTDVAGVQIIALPSFTTLYNSSGIWYPTEHILTFPPIEIAEIRIRFMNYGSATNDWDAYLYEAGFGAYSGVRTKDRVTGIVHRVGPGHYSEELILGGLDTRWHYVDYTPEPIPAVPSEAPKEEGVWLGPYYEITATGMRFYYLAPDGTKHYITDFPHGIIG